MAQTLHMALLCRFKEGEENILVTPASHAEPADLVNPGNMPIAVFVCFYRV